MYITRQSAIWHKSVFVLIDLEYSGNLEDSWGRNCNIWEIAACCGDKTFHALINPYLTRDVVSRPVSERYKMPSMEEFEERKAVSFPQAINNFTNFLRALLQAEDQYIILASHNGNRGDKQVLEYELLYHKMYQQMLKLPIHFFDTLYFVRSRLPNQVSYSIPKLYESLFHEPIEDVHTATSDVQALKRILEHINEPLEGAVFMLFLTPFSNVPGIGTGLQKRFFNAGYCSLEHFFYMVGFDLSNINQALLQGRIITNNIYKLNKLALQLYTYGSQKLGISINSLAYY